MRLYSREIAMLILLINCSGCFGQQRLWVLSHPNGYTEAPNSVLGVGPLEVAHICRDADALVIFYAHRGGGIGTGTAKYVVRSVELRTGEIIAEFSAGVEAAGIIDVCGQGNRYCIAVEGTRDSGDGYIANLSDPLDFSRTEVHYTGGDLRNTLCSGAFMRTTTSQECELVWVDSGIVRKARITGHGKFEMAGRVVLLNGEVKWTAFSRSGDVLWKCDKKVACEDLLPGQWDGARWVVPGDTSVFLCGGSASTTQQGDAQQIIVARSLKTGAYLWRKELTWRSVEAAYGVGACGFVHVEDTAGNGNWYLWGHDGTAIFQGTSSIVMLSRRERVGARYDGPAGRIAIGGERTQVAVLNEKTGERIMTTRICGIPRYFRDNLLVVDDGKALLSVTVR